MLEKLPQMVLLFLELNVTRFLCEGRFSIILSKIRLFQKLLDHSTSRIFSMIMGRSRYSHNDHTEASSRYIWEP